MVAGVATHLAVINVFALLATGSTQLPECVKVSTCGSLKVLL